MLKLRCFASAAILLMGTGTVSATDLGYQTESSATIGLGGSGYSSNQQSYFTQPAHSNRSTQPYSGSYSASYYRSYHAHQDAALNGAYAYGAPWAWAYHGEGYPNPYHTYPLSQLDTTAAPPPTRSLLKTQGGQCYELQRNSKGEELRTEIDAENCNW